MEDLHRSVTPLLCGVSERSGTCLYKGSFHAATNFIQMTWLGLWRVIEAVRLLLQFIMTRLFDYDSSIILKSEKFLLPFIQAS